MFSTYLDGTGGLGAGNAIAVDVPAAYIVGQMYSTYLLLLC
jgi:hypothetical protein